MSNKKEPHMGRDLLLFLVIALLFLALMPHQRSAPVLDETSPRLYVFPDELAKVVGQADGTPADAVKTFQYQDKVTSEDGTVRWTLRLSASFARQGDAYVCTAADYQFDSYNTTWYQVSGDVTFHGDTAECTVAVGQRYFWIPVKKDTFTFTLTCAPDGTLT